MKNASIVLAAFTVFAGCNAAAPATAPSTPLPAATTTTVIATPSRTAPTTTTTTATPPVRSTGGSTTTSGSGTGSGSGTATGSGTGSGSGTRPGSGSGSGSGSSVNSGTAQQVIQQLSTLLESKKGDAEGSAVNLGRACPSWLTNDGYCNNAQLFYCSDDGSVYGADCADNSQTCGLTGVSSTYKDCIAPSTNSSNGSGSGSGSGNTSQSNCGDVSFAGQCNDDGTVSYCGSDGTLTDHKQCASGQSCLFGQIDDDGDYGYDCFSDASMMSDDMCNGVSTAGVCSYDGTSFSYCDGTSVQITYCDNGCTDADPSDPNSTAYCN